MDFHSLFGVCDEERGDCTAGAIPFAVVSGDFPKSGIALPMGNRAVRAASLRELYHYKGKTPTKRLKIKLLQCFNFAFVWKIVFSRRFSVHPHGGILSLFSSVKSQWSNVICSVYIGKRKILLPLFDKQQGTLLGYVKIYRSDTESNGRNEANILHELAYLDLKSASVPKVLFKGCFNEFFVLILSSETDFENFSSIASVHEDFLTELSEKTGERLLFELSPFAKEIDKKLSSIESRFPEEITLIRYFYEKAILNLKGKVFSFSLVKREFPYFEILKSRVNSQLFVLDWEHAHQGFPPIFDLFSMVLSLSPYRKGNYIELYEKNIRKLFFGESLHWIITRMLSKWNITAKDAYWFFFLFLIDQLSIFLSVEESASAERIICFFRIAKSEENELKRRWFGGGAF